MEVKLSIDILGARDYNLLMHILLTNDDGIFAPGLAAIYRKLTKLGKVTVVAPANCQSGASHSITYQEPLLMSKTETELFCGFSVQGSPADCVKLAILELCDEKIDLVVAGINHGANAGINVYYSGTVAAAIEAAFLDIPSVAMSLAMCETMDFERAAEHCLRTLEKILPLQAGEIVNMNIPRLTDGEPKGIKIVPQSIGGYHEKYEKHTNSIGQKVFQLKGGDHRQESSCSDIIALVDGYITLTALNHDMTNHLKTDLLRKKHQTIISNPHSAGEENG